MRARAPGKLVLSGAYSVLEGATALVAAVDRYVVADASCPASFVTAEVAEAVRCGLMSRAIGFDAAALRESMPDGGSRKLGLGSSAAILVSSMAAVRLETGASVDGLATSLFPDALRVHRAAQGGGSGIDVAASAFGGTLACCLTRDGLDVRPVRLPPVTFEAWACTTSASTAEMIEKIRAFAAREPSVHRLLLERAGAAAERASVTHDVAAFVAALTEQRVALGELGRRAAADIVTAEVTELARVAEQEGASFYPAGAGGGDVALHVAEGPSSNRFRARAESLGLTRLSLSFGAPGVGPM